jgi:hypothetical protein
MNSAQLTILAVTIVVVAVTNYEHGNNPGSTIITV